MQSSHRRTRGRPSASESSGSAPAPHPVADHSGSLPWPRGTDVSVTAYMEPFHTRRPTAVLRYWRTTLTIRGPLRPSFTTRPRSGRVDFF